MGFKPIYDRLLRENIETEWITFLCQEELKNQGDIDDHVRSSHAFDMSETKNEYRISKAKKSNLILEGARNIKHLPESSLEKLLESWYNSAVANNIFITDQGRNVDEIRPEKSAHLMKAISRTLEPETWDTFKINMGHKVERKYDISKMFSCKWIKIEEALKESLGEAPNINRLINCIKKEDWEDLTLQQALHEINNFHNNSLKTQQSLYTKKNGDLAEYRKNLDSAKIQSAMKLARELPKQFDQFELQKDLSNAYYETHESFEDVVEKLEYLIKHRGLNTLYTTTKIKIKKNLPPWWTPEQPRNGNGNQAKQRKKKENQDTTTLNTIDNKKPIKDLEPKPESVLTYKAKEMEINNETRIKPEDRFEDITFQNPTDWEAFDNLAKDHGIPTLADLKKGENYSAYLIKTDYITEPEPHPYQEILEKGNHLEIKEKIIAENFTSTNETKEVINIKKDRVPGIWHRNKGDTKSPKQKQNNMKNSECKRCNKEFVSKERLGVHEAVCKEKTIMTIESRNIKKTTKVKKTEDNIENKTQDIKIEKKEDKEVLAIKDDKKASEESIKKAEEEALKIKRNEEIEEVKKIA